MMLIVHMHHMDCLRLINHPKCSPCFTLSHLGTLLSVQAPATDAAQERLGDPGVARVAGGGYVSLSVRSGWVNPQGPRPQVFLKRAHHSHSGPL